MKKKIMNEGRYESISLMYEFIRELKELLNRYSHKCVVWLGVHPWLPFILDLLLDEDCSEILIVDNDKKKQGQIYFPYRCPNESFRVKDIMCLSEIVEDTLFLMANTHEVEFEKQLYEMGIKKEINNLYDYTLCEQTFVKEGIKYAENNMFRPLKGRNLQLRELEILKEFKKICLEGGLRYWIGAGTLLGAVRHGGFIPWDDDIDVEMPYEDYCMLVKNFSEDENFYLLNWRLQDDYTMNFSKLVDKGTFLIHDGWFPNVCSMGCYIDIFPVGGYSSNKEQIERKWIIDDYLDRLWNHYYMTREIYEQKDPRDDIEREKFSYSFDEAEMVGGMHRIAQKRWAVPKTVFTRVEEIRFEDDLFPAPIEYDLYLGTRYGKNYMQVPSKDKQRTHSFYTYEVR